MGAEPGCIMGSPGTQFNKTQRLNVSVETEKEKYSGVRCYSCGEAIPLPAKTVQKVHARAEKAEAGHVETPVVFNLRCKACEKESFYGVQDIVQMEGTPRISRAAARANSKLMRPLSGGL